MAQLLVRKLDDKLVGRLKRRAAANGVSMEEEHRRLLRAALEVPKKAKLKMNLLDYLSTMPDVGDNYDWKIHRVGKMREIDFE